MITYPISITDKDPDTFTFSPSELGITPITTNTAVILPLFEDEAAPNTIGTPRSIWIGRTASLDLITSSVGETWRHEIQSLAFEDGRTDLLENIMTYNVECTISQEEQEAMEQSDPNHTGSWNDYYDENGIPWYNRRTTEDAGSNYDSLYDWGSNFSCTKSLRLPEGLTSFTQFPFRHSNFDKHVRDNYWDYYYQTPTDFRIYVPSTITEFKIVGGGWGQEYRDSYDPRWSGGSYTPENVLYFGPSDDGTSYSIWKAGENTSITDSYVDIPSDIEDVPQFFETYPHDTVHIYLRNHSSVPNITFVGGIYFPIVFHLNGAIFKSFKQRYEGTVSWKPGNDDLDYDYDIISFVADMGELSDIKTVALSTPLSSVALSGVPSLSNNDITEALEGIHLDWYKVDDEKINSSTATSGTACTFHQYITETDMETNEEKCIHIVGSLSVNTSNKTSNVSITSANYVQMEGDTITSTLGTVSGISVTSTFVEGPGAEVNIDYKGIILTDKVMISSN